MRITFKKGTTIYTEFCLSYHTGLQIFEDGVLENDFVCDAPRYDEYASKGSEIKKPVTEDTYVFYKKDIYGHNSYVKYGDRSTSTDLKGMLPTAIIIITVIAIILLIKYKIITL